MRTLNLKNLPSLLLVGVSLGGTCLLEAAEIIPKRLDCYVGSSARVTVRMAGQNVYEGWISYGPFAEGSHYDYDHVDLTVGSGTVNPLLIYKGFTKLSEGKFEMRVKRAESGMYKGFYQGQIEWNHPPQSPSLKKENLSFCREN